MGIYHHSRLRELREAMHLTGFTLVFSLSMAACGLEQGADFADGSANFADKPLDTSQSRLEKPDAASELDALAQRPILSAQQDAISSPQTGAQQGEELAKLEETANSAGQPLASLSLEDKAKGEAQTANLAAELARGLDHRFAAKKDGQALSPEQAREFALKAEGGLSLAQELAKNGLPSVAGGLPAQPSGENQQAQKGEAGESSGGGSELGGEANGGNSLGNSDQGLGHRAGDAAEGGDELEEGGLPPHSEMPQQEEQSTLYPHSLSLVQEEASKVDILWIIDSSLSMAEEQAYLGANFNSFINGLSASKHSFQTAITTTDICFLSQPESLAERVCPFAYGGNSSTHLRGSYVGQEGRKVLRHDDKDLVSLFADYTAVGTNGSNFEHGLEAVKLAVGKDLAGENENLIRSDAFLSVIIVSDEEDDGIGFNRIDPFLNFNPTAEGLTTHSFTNDELIAYLEQVKGKGHFSISTIAGVRDANGKLCRSPHSQPAEEGTALIAAAQKTGGIIQSICETDWSESLQQIGQDLSAQIAQIALPKIALKTSVKVKVDGALYTRWSFIEGQNSIKFDSDALPAPGTQIEVSYNSLEP